MENGAGGQGRERPIPGLGGICSPWGILGQGYRGRSCSASRRGSPIAPGNGHLLGLRSILSTVGTEDHPVELGHTGLVEAVGNSEVRVAFQEGSLGKREKQ